MNCFRLFGGLFGLLLLTSSALAQGAGDSTTADFSVPQAKQDEGTKKESDAPVQTENIRYGLRAIMPDSEDKTNYELRLGSFVTDTLVFPHEDRGKDYRSAGAQIFLAARPWSADTDLFDTGSQRFELGFYAGAQGQLYRTDSHEGYRIDSRFGLEIFAARINASQHATFTLTQRIGLTLHREGNEALDDNSDWRLLYKNNLGADLETMLGFHRAPDSFLFTDLVLSCRLVEGLEFTTNNTLERVGKERASDFVEANSVNMIAASAMLRIFHFGDRRLTLDGHVVWTSTRVDEYRYNTADGRRRENQQVQTIIGGGTLRLRISDEVYLYFRGLYAVEVKNDGEKATYEGGLEVLAW